MRIALEKAFDYRGDIQLTLKDGSIVEGYVFDRRSAATLAGSAVRVIPAKERSKPPSATPTLRLWPLPDATPQQARASKPG